MKLANRFKNEDKIRVWSQHQYCALCGSNQNCSLHHIRLMEEMCNKVKDYPGRLTDVTGEVYIPKEAFIQDLQDTITNLKKELR